MRAGHSALSPAVTVVMANYNGAAFVEAALRSALAQSLGHIEIVVADDASTDDSAARIAAIAACDERVRLLRAPRNGGPSAARNLCLDAAQGRWIAVMDGDDLMHPQRLERLLMVAERDHADIVADDLLIFHDDGVLAPETCLRGRAAKAPFWVEAADYVRANVLFSGPQALGYLKPLIRADLLTAHRYDPQLRIVEDYDFILRLLLGGARLRVYPGPTYFYRKHARSVSHRTNAGTLAAMLDAHDRSQALFAGQDERLDAAMAARRASIRHALDFDTLLAALRRREWCQALAQAWRQPRVAALLRGPVHDRLRRRLAHRQRRIPPVTIGCRDAN
jgi:succinoglycan biosynthesis protein ExoO